MTRTVFVFSLILPLAACRSDSVDVQTAEVVPVQLDSRNSEKILRFALGSYTDGADPMENGLLIADGGSFALNPQRLPAYARSALDDLNENGAVDRDELWAMLNATYYRAREAPESLAALREQADLPESEDEWFVVDVSGAMTAALRRIRVPKEALRSALSGYTDEQGIRYPEGTVIVGAHLADDEQTVLETTVKWHRADGFWDFFVYDGEGELTTSTDTEPRGFRAPTQCTGCHLGQKLYAPESSFPARAPDGPFGPRAYFVPESWRNAEVAARFQEHARRSGDVLGIYGTLYVSKLLAEREAGEELSSRDRELLNYLGY